MKENKENKENKEIIVAARLTENQSFLLDKMVSDGLVKNKSAAIQYLINKAIILGQ
ncbi:Uncharacterised protein [Yersinia rohdei]|uniref:Uncharacterized protein n=1 Tax=Yersinia rohdei TaxID=29485 RepID=A0A0U1HUP8_YERRO|nr:hypothetical protein [Yersinia rohdei]CQI92622.1 Uncharacterised protein [Yersinia rohdei]